MKLSVQQVFDITLAVSAIIREHRPMPQRGKYLLARMHAKLLPEFNVAAARRDEMIMAYDNQTEAGWVVPEGKMPEFTKVWDEVGTVEVEVDVTPISLADLDLPGTNGGIEAAELALLGDLVVD